METVPPDAIALADTTPAVSWASIAAGTVVSAALTLALLALGAGLGLSSVSPWSDSVISAPTFKIASGIYLVIVSVVASALGGYLASRLRTKWAGVHTNEVFFRDTAHGFITWAFATVLSASALGTAATHAVGGLASAGVAAGQVGQNEKTLHVRTPGIVPRAVATLIVTRPQGPFTDEAVLKGLLLSDCLIWERLEAKAQEQKNADRTKHAHAVILQRLGVGQAGSEETARPRSRYHSLLEQDDRCLDLEPRTVLRVGGNGAVQ